MLVFAMSQDTQTARVPWYLWVGLFGSSCAPIGIDWDISWHHTIGRDTFFTPPHMTVAMCVVAAAVTSIYVLSVATFGRSAAAAQLRAVSINVFGMRAPTGVFLAAWGGLSMLTASWFDNWWHAAYGLDAVMFSLPHTLLMLSMLCIELGNILLLVATLNRTTLSGQAQPRGQTTARTLQRLMLYQSGLLVLNLLVLVADYTLRVRLHSSSPYVYCALLVPVLFAGLAPASRSRWACTTMAAVYTVIVMVEVLVLPLFPAVPRLGPIGHMVTHYIPQPFPLLIVVPALALDLLWQRTAAWRRWQVVVVSAVVFVAVLLAAEWPFATFLNSAAAENRFFGSQYLGYQISPGTPEMEHGWVKVAHGMALVRGMVRATVYGCVSMALGVAAGGWLRRVQR